MQYGDVRANLSNPGAMNGGAMARQDNPDVVGALQQLTDAADDFVNRAPRVKRIEDERAALLNAITHAELVLSVHRLPNDREQEVETATRSKRRSLPQARLKTPHNRPFRESNLTREGEQWER